MYIHACSIYIENIHDLPAPRIEPPYIYIRLYVCTYMHADAYSIYIENIHDSPAPRIEPPVFSHGC